MCDVHASSKAAIEVFNSTLRKSSLHTVMGKGSDLAGTVPNLPTVVVEKEINCSTLNKITLGNCIVTYDRGS